MSNPYDPYQPSQPQDPQNPSGGQNPGGQNPGGQGGSSPYGSPSQPSQPYGSSHPYGTPAGGGQGGYPAYGAPFGGDQAPKKGVDGVSIAGFVLSLTCCLSFIGLILGFVGLKRTKPGGHSGRWAAVSAIVLGILGTLATVGFVAIVVLFPTESIDDLETGQCITGNGLDLESDDGVSGIKLVECDEPHDAEVLGTKRLSSDEAADYDIDDTTLLSTLCTDVVDAEVLGGIDPNEFSLVGLTQSEEPDSGDQLACIAVRTDGGELDEPLG